MRTFVMLGLFACGVASNAQLTLGPYVFNNAQFGDTLIESDGGAHSGGNWLNTTNANPGNPAYLTGANVETGIANIPAISYTIGYANPIVNVAGDDLGVIVARYSSDNFTMAVSTDGVAFTGDMFISSGTAVATGVARTYFYGGNGPFPSELWVHPIDLTTFGIAGGASIQAVRITGETQLDLIRAAGLVPEPTTASAVGLALVALAARRRRR